LKKKPLVSPGEPSICHLQPGEHFYEQNSLIRDLPRSTLDLEDHPEIYNLSTLIWVI
jgi:hypothetical protein